MTRVRGAAATEYIVMVVLIAVVGVGVVTLLGRGLSRSTAEAVGRLDNGAPGGNLTPGGGTPAGEPLTQGAAVPAPTTGGAPAPAASGTGGSAAPRTDVPPLTRGKTNPLAPDGGGGDGEGKTSDGGSTGKDSETTECGSEDSEDKKSPSYAGPPDGRMLIEGLKANDTDTLAARVKDGMLRNLAKSGLSGKEQELQKLIDGLRQALLEKNEAKVSELLMNLGGAAASAANIIPGIGFVSKVGTYVVNWGNSLRNYKAGMDTTEIMKSLLEASHEAQKHADAAKAIRDKWIKEWDDAAGALDPNPDRTPYTPPPYRNLRKEYMPSEQRGFLGIDEAAYFDDVAKRHHDTLNPKKGQKGS